MTECITNPIAFSSLGRRRIVADFNGGALSSDSGLLLLREAERRTGLIDAMAAAIPDPRDPDAITHEQVTMLRQRIFSLAQGYEDLNDQQTLRTDPLLQAASGKNPACLEPLASPPTLCRLENRIRRATLVKLSKLFVDQFIASHPTPPQELILDFDATDDPVHGKQEGRFFHGYYDHYCFLPLYVFCGDELLVSYLRPSNIDPATHVWAILSLLVRRLRQVWPQTRIIFRGDSGFCRWRMLRWCDRHDVGYIVGMARNPVLERLAQPWMALAQEQFQTTGRKQRLFAVVNYAAATWDRPRELILKAEYGEQGENPRFVVTNLLEHQQAQTLYDQGYCARGEMENRIKEQQLHLFAGRTSCHGFPANQFRLLLASAAYLLVQTIRRVGLGGTPMAQAQVNTIRLRLFKIAARVVVSARRILLHLASACPDQDLFEQCVLRLRTPPTLASG